MALDILHTIPEDTGTYSCQAKNPIGTAETRASMVCYCMFFMNISIFKNPQTFFDLLARVDLPADSLWGEQDEWNGDIVMHQQPQFTTNLKDCQVKESGRAHFEARVVPQGDPHLKVEWFKDGFPLKMGTVL